MTWIKAQQATPAGLFPSGCHLFLLLDVAKIDLLSGENPKKRSSTPACCFVTCICKTGVLVTHAD